MEDRIPPFSFLLPQLFGSGEIRQAVILQLFSSLSQAWELHHPGFSALELVFELPCHRIP